MSVWVTKSSVWYQLFPWDRTATPDEFAEQEIKNPKLQANVEALANAVSQATEAAVLQELRDIATAKLKSEEDRQASITARAQSLLAALALFGFILTFAVTLLTTTSAISRTAAVAWGLIALYVVAQVIVVMVSILGAIRGIGTRSAGSSDLASWVAKKNVCDFYRDQALAYLDYYRWHSLTNTWRFAQLGNAVRGFRNIVFSLAGLALTILAFAIFKPEVPSDATKLISAIRLDISLKTCTVSGFAAAKHQLGTPGIKALKQAPSDCFDEIQKRVCSGDAAFAVIIGHADKRELGLQPQRYYGSNLSLAYQRAREIENQLVKSCQNAGSTRVSPDLPSRLWTLASGSANVGLKLEEASLEADRSVEIRAYGVEVRPTGR